MPVQSCQSTDPRVALNLYFYGDTSACTFSFTVRWGDKKTQTFRVVDPKDGYRFISRHTYPYLASWTINITGRVESGSCVANGGNLHFMLLAYAALGDSFSSGVGAGDYLLGTETVVGNDCLQSRRAYPELADKYLGDNPANVYDPFVFVACNGATIADFTQAQRKGVPAQLGYIDGPSPDWIGLVTLTVGGNDLNFAGIMSYCASRSPKEQTCQAKFGGAVDKALGTIEVRLFNLYATIRREHSLAPTARVLVLGYPRFFPANQAKQCPTGWGYSAGHGHFKASYFVPSDMKWINGAIARLDADISKAAAAAGVTYVNTYGALGGHELCQSQPWLNAAVPISLAGIGTASYHPKAAGQQALAAVAERSVPR